MENPEDVCDKWLEFIFKKYIDNFIAIHAIDLYKIADKIGVIGNGKDPDIADKVIHTESFVRKVFRYIFVHFRSYWATVWQIIDIKMIPN